MNNGKTVSSSLGCLDRVVTHVSLVPRPHHLQSLLLEPWVTSSQALPQLVVGRSLGMRLDLGTLLYVSDDGTRSFVLSPYDGRYDDLLYFFAYQHGVVEQARRDRTKTKDHDTETNTPSR